MKRGLQLLCDRVWFALVIQVEIHAPMNRGLLQSLPALYQNNNLLLKGESR